MKKLLLTLGLCCSVSVMFAQYQDNRHYLQDSKHILIGYVRNGSIFDNDNNFLGQFKVENAQYTVLNRSHKPVGYIKGKEVFNIDNKTVGYIKTNPDYSTTVEDANHALLGTIKADGTVEDKNQVVKGYQVKTEPAWAAAYYFFLKL
jgi:hypothetical protein